MKKFKLIEETQYMLTDETRSDRQLNAVDLNMLAILQYIQDGKANNSDWFNVLIKHPKGKWDDDRYTSVEKYFDEFGVKTDYTTLNRSINKLQRLGYIEYRTGFYNNSTNSGMTPRIKLIKGTINIDGSINCSDIAITKENSAYDEAVKLITGDSDSYSNIAIAKEKEKYKENKKENNNTYNISDFSGERNHLFVILDKCDDEGDNLNGLLYLDEHYTNENIEYIRKWWRDKPEWLEELNRYCQRTDKKPLPVQ